MPYNLNYFLQQKPGKWIVMNLSQFIWSNDLNKHINGNEEKAEVKMVKQITSLIVDYFRVTNLIKE